MASFSVLASVCLLFSVRARAQYQSKCNPCLTGQQQGYSNNVFQNMQYDYASQSGYKTLNYGQSAQNNGFSYSNQQYYNPSSQYGTNNATTGASSSNSSQPGYLPNYSGDNYTDTSRIQETQKLNAPFFASINGEPRYPGGVDSSSNSSSFGSYGNNQQYVNSSSNQ